jgi:hypothetical protein
LILIAVVVIVVVVVSPAHALVVLNVSHGLPVCQPSCFAAHTALPHQFPTFS